MEQRMEQINEDIRIMDKILKEEMQGFLTHYTEKIIKLTEPFTKEYVEAKIRNHEELQVKNVEKKFYWTKFWESFDYHYKNSPDFKEKADEIFSKIFKKEEDI